MKTHARTLLVLCLLILAAFLLRTISLDTQPLWRDEIDALRFATAPWSEVLSNFTRSGWNGPLYFLVLRGWIFLTGSTGCAMRFLSLWFGVLCIPLVFVLGRKFFGRNVALMAAFLITSSPYLIWYSQEVKMYSLVPALALLALYALRRATAGQGWYWWVTAVAATSIGFYSHILMALLIPVEIAFGLLWWPDTRRQWRGALASLLCLTVPYLPLLFWQLPLATTTRETGFYPYTLPEMVRILANGWSLGILVKGTPWGTLPAIGLVLAGLLRPLVGARGRPASSMSGRRRERSASPRSRQWRPRVFLMAWLIIPVMLIALISMRQPLFTDRYLVWLSPAFYLLVALGVVSLRYLRRWGVWLAAVSVSLLLLISAVNIWAQATVPVKADFRAAADYVLATLSSEESDIAGVPAVDARLLDYRQYLPLISRSRNAVQIPGLIIFQIPHGRYSFEYYAGGVTYTSADGLYTNSRLPDGSYRTLPEGIDGQMRQMTAGYSDVWLIITEMEMWDERGLVRSWFETNGRLVDAVHFTKVDLTRYTLGLSQQP